ncbi:hypothetical protein [Clostridium cellulovorans]|uniref:Uncharacterized protein n=1 Tax=Clostridium cellulovorans (strain ATCC 35296 / DSM 3052 / OCM 3 / 743B) TaxID=573061 RepID=D9SUS1_CLOC7|nr:hypothetical protein [Clostridium cellulovorans]ADL50976.1 hypothetical protein Clocel_1221 [Clostridium cellulovorans 743B]
MSPVDGEWNVHETVSSEDKQILATALEGHLVANYEPVAVASQAVNGVNYLFIAKSTPVTLNPRTDLVKIYVSVVPAGSEPELIAINSMI